MAVTFARNYTDNSPASTLPVGINNSITSFAVSSLAGFPTSLPYYAVIDLNQASAEVVEVTNAVGTTVTVVRNANGQGAFSHPANAAFQHALVARDLQDANDHQNATAGVHGVSGNVVGDTDTQTLTNKTLTTPAVTGLTGSLNGPVITAAAYADDTGWLDLVIFTGDSFPFNVAPGHNAQVRLRDGQVHFRGALQCSSLTGFTENTGAQLPVGFSHPPTQDRVFAMPDTSQAATRYCRVTTAGNLNFASTALTTAFLWLDTITYRVD